jgi:hypothetical protein
MLGLVEDEHTFSIVSFMNNRLQNWLNTHLDLCTRFYINVFLLFRISIWASHCQVGWQNLLLCKCVSDSIDVLGALQNAHLGSKPNLDVLGVTFLTLWFMSHYCSYINYLILISITWWVYFCLQFIFLALVVQFVAIFFHIPMNVFLGGAYHLSSWDGFKDWMNETKGVFNEWY